VAISVLSTTGRLVSPAGAQESTTSGSLKSSEDEAVGASISHPAEFIVEREQFTLDDTYGFTLWKPKSGSSRDAHDHGETTPAVRVARARRLQPKEIERKVRTRITEHPDLSMKREEVVVSSRGLKGVAVGPIPGSTPSTEVYVPVEGRVYQINVYGEELNSEGRQLLKRVKFGRPTQSIESLDLADGKKAETHQQEGDTTLVEAEQLAREAALEADSLDETVTAAASGEYQTYEGCWVADSTFFFQTQHGKYANKRWGAAWTGWTQIGNPNYWGQYTHGDYGYGRCTSPYYTNDMYAIDYPLAKGDVVFSPFRGGTVTFAGRNYSHKNYGIFVVVKADNGKYVSMSAHLSGLASGIRRGAYVTNRTILGYAGNTGDPSIPVGPTHLHQAFYRYPRYNRDGSPYGGAGLQVAYHRYTGTAARKAGYSYSSGTYSYGLTTPNYNATCREGIRCGEGYAISN